MIIQSQGTVFEPAMNPKAGVAFRLGAAVGAAFSTVLWHPRLVVERQVFQPGRVLPMGHRTARPYRLPPRRTADRHGGCFLLGQRLQILLKPDHPVPEDLFGVCQVSNQSRLPCCTPGSSRSTCRRNSVSARA